MSGEYKSPFFSDEWDDSANDLYSTSDKQLDLNSFVKPKNNSVPSRKKRGTKNVKEKKGIGRILLSGFLVMVITFCLIIGSFAIYVFGFVDDDIVENLDDLKLDFTTTLYVKDVKTGEYKEYQRLHGPNNRIWVKFSDMPDNLKMAFVAIEDQRFYSHNGVDWKRTVSAFANMFVDLYSSNQGGSTITQQLVKNLTGDNRQSPMRKIREIMRARKLESQYAKDTILECYLNTVSFANGIYGVEVASNYYFDKSAKDLNLAECATLAAIVKAPETYRPDTNYEKNTQRRKLVLGKMLELSEKNAFPKEFKGITKEEYDKAISEEVKIVASKENINEVEVNSYFVDALIDDVVKDLMEKYNYDKTYAENNFYNGGYKIYTTLDTNIQSIVEKVYNDTKYFPKSRRTGIMPQSSFTIMDYQGHVVGIAGGVGKKTQNRSLNRATSSPRPPGSTMKPLGAYSLALDMNLITYSTIFNDQPITLANNKKWPPNWYGYYGGKLTVAKALERSVNTVPAQIVQQLTVEKSFDYLTNNLGITTLERDANKDLTYSSLALGGSYKGITTLESAAAYAVFGNKGKYYEPTFYTKVTDQHGNVILDGEPLPKVAIGEDTAVIMNHLLQQPVYGSQGTGRGAASYVPNMKIYAKTGTTDSTNDLWFVGGTPYYIASCWYGFDTPEPITNGGAALKVWGAIMQQVHKSLTPKSFEESEFVTVRRYCTSTGLIATSACPSTGIGYYKTTYLQPCTSHRGTMLGEVKLSSNVSSGSDNTSSTSSTSSTASTATSTSSVATSSVPSSSSQTTTSTSSTTSAGTSTSSSSVTSAASSRASSSATSSKRNSSN